MKQKILEIGPARICQVVTDNPNVNKALRRKMEEDFPHIIGSCCTTHQFDLLTEDVGKLSWAKGTLANCDKIVTNVRNHDMVLKTFKTHSQVNLLKPGETRFATQFIMLDRLRNSKESVIKCYIDPVLAESVSKKAPSYKELFQTAKDLIFDPQFWLDVNYLYAILEPIIKLLRLSDNSSKIPVGFVGVIYHKFYLFTINVANFTYRNRIHRSDMIKLVNDRWVQLHSPLHSAGFVSTLRIRDMTNTPIRMCGKTF